ncbi:TPA: hypothetical protein IGZ69_003493 [Escherichia coli]|nr:hypothetical protein [Escherichia coli]HBC0974486.1 hypothetical protein [Escherichia coli]
MLTYVITNCNYFKIGMQELFNCKKNVNFIYETSVEKLKSIPAKDLQVILAVELITLTKSKKFWDAVVFLSKNKTARVGVVFTKYNAYLMRYLSKKMLGATFFYANNLRKFVGGVCRWCNGYSYREIRTIDHCNDSHGLSINELTILTLSLLGENVYDIAINLGLSISSIYRIRNNAIYRLGFKSYHDFSQAYIKGEIRLEYERHVEVRGTLLIAH